MKSKQEKREEAQERQAYYASLSVNDKLDQLNRRRGASQREREKLWRLIAAQAKVAA